MSAKGARTSVLWVHSLIQQCPWALSLSRSLATYTWILIGVVQAGAAVMWVSSLNSDGVVVRRPVHAERGKHATRGLNRCVNHT